MLAVKEHALIYIFFLCDDAQCSCQCSMLVKMCLIFCFGRMKLVDFIKVINFFVLDGKRVTASDEIKAIRWATWTGVLGSEANGIWPKYADTNDVNAVDAYYGGEVMVTGDDFGLVKLFRFPSLKRGK